MTLRYGSVCSGIEAATVAWHPLGFTPVFFSEIEKFPCRVLAHHYGSNMPGEPHASNGVPNYGDMTKFREWPDAAIDLLAGGTPCQSFSIAGLRAGLDDPRGNLALTFLALAERYRPRWVVWENVPGVLSSNGGGDFAAFLGGLSGIGYGWAYRVLDAQYVRVDGHARAVPQRRRRVFVVGYSGGDWRRAAAVLFEPEGLRGHSPPRREAGQGAAGGVGGSFNLGGEWRGEGGGECQPGFGMGQGQNKSGCPRSAVTPTRPSRSRAGTGAFIAIGGGPDGGRIAGSESSKWAKGTGGPAGDEAYNLVAHALRAEGFDASEDGTGRGTPLVPIAFPEFMGATAHAAAENLSPALGAKNPTAVAMPICFDETQITSATNRSNPQPGDPCHTLVKGAIAPSIAFAIQERAVSENPDAGPDGVGVQADIAYTLEARNQVQACAYDMRGREGGAQFEGPHQTANIRAGSGGSSRSYVQQQWAVRRLTPRECERLQGFPDSYTDIPKASDGGRYKALGNSMAVNVMRWIGMRIQIADAVFREMDRKNGRAA